MTNVVTNLLAAAVASVIGTGDIVWARYNFIDEGNFIDECTYTNTQYGSEVGPSRTTEEQVKDLAESGEVCKIYGHWWKPWWPRGREEANGVVSTPAVYIPNPPDKQCHLCGATARHELVIMEGE